MTLHRYAAKRDATEPEIVAAMRRVGAKVLLLDKFDSLVWFRGQLYMIDSKSRHGRTTMAQQRLLDEGWPLRMAKTPDEALKAIGAMK